MKALDGKKQYCKGTCSSDGVRQLCPMKHVGCGCAFAFSSTRNGEVSCTRKNQEFVLESFSDADWSSNKSHRRSTSRHAHDQRCIHVGKQREARKLFRCQVVRVNFMLLSVVLAMEFSLRLFFRPTPSWLPPGRSTCSIACCRLVLIS